MTDKETLKELQYADQLRVKPKVLRIWRYYYDYQKPMQLKAFIKKAAEKNISAQGKLNTPFRCCSMTAASASLLMTLNVYPCYGNRMGVSMSCPKCERNLAQMKPGFVS